MHAERRATGERLVRVGEGESVRDFQRISENAVAAHTLGSQLGAAASGEAIVCLETKA